MSTDAQPSTTLTPDGAKSVREASIQSAIDDMFATREAKPVPPNVTPPAEVTTSAETVAKVTDAATADATDPAAAAETPKPAKASASDYAIELAKLKRKQAAAPKAEAPKPKGPSDAAMARALAFEQAGDDPIKQLEATGIPFEKLIDRYEKQITEDASLADPYARALKDLQDELSAMKEDRAKERASTQAREEKEAETNFIKAARQLAASMPDEFEYVDAEGDDGYDYVKSLVLDAHREGKFLSLPDALRKAERELEAVADRLASTKKLAKKFSQPTHRPAIAQQAPAAGMAPISTKSKTASDVINESIDALLG